MDSNIEQLLEKYWMCETSLEEEQQLRAFFLGKNVPESMKATAEMFLFFEGEKNKSLNENFEPTVTKELRQRRGGKVVSMVSFTNISRIAAGIVVMVAATYFIRQEVRKSYPQELQDTYSDPQLALEETKKALMMISNSFNSAQKDAGKIKAFSEAEEKIQDKAPKEKSTI
ncbi:MAG: hypothetical protein HOP08_06020 [Cyclobacteriaceae bacterium]|nr:hypothetical protein [Cyclobacteriaceae bacterium]